MLLDTYAPLKSINKYKLKLKSKPWITSEKSTFVKNKLLTNFIIKDPILKEEFHTIYIQKVQKFTSTLMKKSKQAYYNKYFEKKMEYY